MSIYGDRFAWERAFRSRKGGISPGAACVCFAMSSWWSEDRPCYPTLGMLCCATGFERRHVIDLLKEAVKVGWLTKAPPEEQIAGEQTRYILTIPAQTAATEPKKTRRNKATPGTPVPPPVHSDAPPPPCTGMHGGVHSSASPPCIPVPPPRALECTPPCTGMHPIIEDHRDINGVIIRAGETPAPPPSLSEQEQPTGTPQASATSGEADSGSARVGQGGGGVDPAELAEALRRIEDLKRHSEEIKQGAPHTPPPFILPPSDDAANASPEELRLQRLAHRELLRQQLAASNQDAPCSPSPSAERNP